CSSHRVVGADAGRGHASHGACVVARAFPRGRPVRHRLRIQPTRRGPPRLARPTSRPPLSPARFLRALLLVLGVVGLLLFAVTRWVAMPWAVEGPSMAPTLRDGDRVIVALTAYRRHAPGIGGVALL